MMQSLAIVGHRDREGNLWDTNDRKGLVVWFLSFSHFVYVSQVCNKVRFSVIHQVVCVVSVCVCVRESTGGVLCPLLSLIRLIPSHPLTNVFWFDRVKRCDRLYSTQTGRGVSRWVFTCLCVYMCIHENTGVYLKYIWRKTGRCSRGIKLTQVFLFSCMLSSSLSVGGRGGNTIYVLLSHLRSHLSVRCLSENQIYLCHFPAVSHEMLCIRSGTRICSLPLHHLN